MVSAKKFIELILRASQLIESLAQTATNGGSTLGTLKAPYLPPFLPSPGASVSNPPWGKAIPPSVPNTGVTRNYDFVITRQTIAPDGVSKSALLVNGAYPGPTLEANWGDTIKVTVYNRITGPAEGTSMHWHGFLLRDTPWYDGTASAHQCPIAPGKSLTYTFKAELFGTSWYHAHVQAQWVDGLFGPVVIHGPKHAEYDIDVGPVVLNDYFHQPSQVMVDMSNGVPFMLPFSDNNLINGKMNYDCANVTAPTSCVSNAGLSKFRFQSGKTHRLRLINSGAEGLQRFSIDGHTMKVIANDYVAVQPYETDVVTLAIGQRTDIIVKAQGKPTDTFWMRSHIDSVCSLPKQNQALAAIYYEKANTTSVPQSTTKPYTDGACRNDDLTKTVPFYPIPPPQNPPYVQAVDLTLGTNETGSDQFFLNGVTFHPNYNQAIMLLAKQGNISYPDSPQWNVYNFGSNSSVRLVVRNFTPLAHPMHLHGHDYWVLANGNGEWNGEVVNPANPQRRDTQMVPGLDLSNGQPGYLVLDFVMDNPGVWPFHCHIAWHSTTGLYMNILERPDEIKSMNIPSSLAQTCKDWAAFQKQSN